MPTEKQELREKSFTTYQRQLKINQAPMHRCDSKLEIPLLTSDSSEAIMGVEQGYNA